MMNILNKYFTLSLIFTLLILTSCQKDGLYEESEINSQNINTRASNSLAMMCTTSRDCVTADPFGGCLILFPPDLGDFDFAANQAGGSAYINEFGNLAFKLFSKLSIPPETNNTIQDFQVSNMVVPAEVAEELYGYTTGEIIIEEGNYPAEVHNNSIVVNAPSTNGEVEISITYSE